MNDIETGDKVVCIDDVFDKCILGLFTELPVEGRTYVVRDVQMGFTPIVPKKSREGAVKLLLIGVKNPLAENGQEHGFNADRFRKLSQMQADQANIIKLQDAIGKPIEEHLEKLAA
jgi:hypothetical protein